MGSRMNKVAISFIISGALLIAFGLGVYLNSTIFNRSKVHNVLPGDYCELPK